MLKELKFNLKLLLKRKELYYAIFVSLLINVIHAFFVIDYFNNNNIFLNNSFSAEYLYILYNPIVTFSSLIIIIFPIINSLIFCDISWKEKNDGTVQLLYTRLNIKKIYFCRAFIIFSISFIVMFVSFFINYLILRLVFLSGNYLSYFQELPFSLSGIPEFFLDNIRASNIILFVIIITFTISTLYGALSIFSYSVSFWVKQKSIIYVSPLLLLIFSELLFTNIGLKNLSLVRLFQPFSKYTFTDYLLSFFLIIIVSILLLVLKNNKRDYL